MARKNLLKGLVLPKKIEYSVEKQEGEFGEYARVVAYPFERGFGTTIGNMLRRVLLSSIQGYAVSAVMFTEKVDGKTRQVSNEFESLYGVKEDILQIIANIKKLQLRVESGAETIDPFVIECRGAGTVTGRDFEKNGVSVVNGDLVIMTMESGVEIDLEVQIDFGRGYVPFDQQKKYAAQYGVIAIDSLFSPITGVSFSIEPARVGQRNDFDKLLLDVHTNGAISAVDAVAQAAFIAEGFLDSFINFDKSTVCSAAEENESAAECARILDTPVADFGFSAKVMECMNRLGIIAIKDLVMVTEDSLLDAHNFGAVSLKKVKEALEPYGLRLGMSTSEVEALLANKN